jgi:N-acetylglucosamine malate deacetylase 1
MRNIVIFQAHPDDWAYGMGGTAYLLRDAYKIHVINVTKGERGLSKEASEKTAAIRMDEEKAACGIIHADTVFMGQIDGDIYAEKELCDAAVKLLKQLDPVAVFSLWGIDGTVDHAATYGLTLKAMSQAGFLLDIQDTRELYFYETGMGSQTNRFDPDLYIDVSDIFEKKKEIIRCYACQNKNDSLAEHSTFQNSARGKAPRCEYAEGFKTFYPLVNKRGGKKCGCILLEIS